jgi:hypothetical protein
MRAAMRKRDATAGEPHHSSGAALSALSALSAR